MRLTLSICFILFLASCQEKLEEAPTQSARKDTVFQRINAEQSGLFFSNVLTEDLSTPFNVFDYDYFFNGAGVGVADFDNDGLQDIVFTGNQVENKIYKNLGQFQFEDKTTGSGINKNKYWSNGVAIADINLDGLLDIYINQGGPHEKEHRRNLLYINLGNFEFDERATEYGLDDTAISTQSAFFDMEGDGDLDVIVMNESPLYGRPPQQLFQRIGENPDLLHESSSHLYRNDNGKFTDITKEAGLLRPMFGLGLTVSDIDDDGYLDIYIASDYYLPDAMFLNQGDGTFEDASKSNLGQVSFYGMGVDIADINNDARQDILVLDMAIADHYKSKTLMASMNTDRFNMLVQDYGFTPQYMYNTLQLNMGQGRFSNISHLAGLSKTDWSWAAIMLDYDLNGYKDIYVTNGYKRYATDNDTRMAVARAQQEYRGQVPLAVKEKIYFNMPSERLSNIMYANDGSLTFKNVNRSWGLDHPSFSNGAAYGDFDNDGDPDLVVNNIDDQAFLYKNLSVENGLGNYLKVKINGGSTEAYARVEIFYQKMQQLMETKRVKGYRSSVDPDAYFGLGTYKDKIDSVVVTLPSGKRWAEYDVDANQTVRVDVSSAVDNVALKGAMSSNTGLIALESVDPAEMGINYAHVENDYDDFSSEVLLPYKQSTHGPSMTVGDINGDGLEDLILGGASGQSLQVYVQNGGKLTKVKNPVFDEDAKKEDVSSVLFDYEGDGDQDLLVASGGNEFPVGSAQYTNRLYINNGQGQFYSTSLFSLNQSTESTGEVVALDFNNDGNTDIIVGNRIVPQRYPKYASSRILQNKGGELKDVTKEVFPDLAHFGIINDIQVTDFDRDGWQDVIIVGEWSTIGIFKNDQGKFKSLSAQNDLSLLRGWWYSILETDVNHDDLPDYVIGNVGTNTKYKASHEKPLKVFADDFDGNGTWDLVLSNKYRDTYVPLRGRECSSQQMPFISQKYPTYDKFARASIQDIYGEKLMQAYQSEVTEMRSLVLINRGEGKFDQEPLPIQGQMGPILSGMEIDLNSDKFEDIILGGAIHNTEPETPRFDTNLGMAFITGEPLFTYVPNSLLNLYLDGNVKCLDTITLGTSRYLVVGINNGELKLYKITVT